MTTATAKKANRGHLLRAAKKGQLFVKCRFHYTDDYAYDNAVNFSKADDFCQVVIRTPVDDTELRDKIETHYGNGGVWNPEIEEMQEECRRLYREHRAAERNANPGCQLMQEMDFRFKSGHVHGTTENGSFSIHSNLNYDYEIRN